MKSTPKRKLLNFEISDNIFNRLYDIYIGDKDLVIKKLRKVYGILPEELNVFNTGLSAVYRRDNAPDISFIWMIEFDTELVVHESLHAIINTLETAGVKFSRETEEIYAYYQGFLSREIHKKYNQIVQRNKKCKKK
jgi:hypothetical protein